MVSGHIIGHPRLQLLVAGRAVRSARDGAVSLEAGWNSAQETTRGEDGAGRPRHGAVVLTLRGGGWWSVGRVL